jgi:hypothetical protein
VQSLNFTGTLALGNNLAGDYTLIGARGSVTITQAVTAVAVTSTRNPSGFKDSVAFNATVPVGATGGVTFRTNGALFASQGLSGGLASSPATTALPRGTNTVAAEYPGDANYLGSTNSLAQIVTNHPPVAAPMTVTRLSGVTWKIAWSDLATNWSDPDGDPVAFAGLNLVTTNGVNLTTNQAGIFYPATAGAAADQIGYTISDGQGFGVGVINLKTASGNTILSITRDAGNGAVTVKYAGISGFAYWLEAVTNLANPVWQPIGTNTTGSSSGQFTDPFAGNHPQRFYRTHIPN